MNSGRSTSSGTTGIVRGASVAAAKDTEWLWHPPLPIRNSPIFSWPPKLTESLKWLVTTWLPLSDRIILAPVAVISWVYLQPPIERCAEFEFSWIAQMFLRNLGLMILVSGGLHLYFYTFKKQRTKRKFDPRELSTNNRKFLTRNQIWDNIIWTCASGVPIWTAYEVLFMWAYANGFIPYLDWQSNPVWFILLFLLIPIWESMHFYWIHRSLHWKPLYRLAHAVHHRNVNVGPWSGMSMHPIEHVLFLSSVLIHWVVPSHPIHVLFHMQYMSLTAVTGHTGFEGLVVKDKKALTLGVFHHQLHHRYFECNYGNVEMPWDKWFGSFHDGTPEATQRMRDRLRRRGAPMVRSCPS